MILKLHDISMAITSAKADVRVLEVDVQPVDIEDLLMQIPIEYLIKESERRFSGASQNADVSGNGI